MLSFRVFKKTTENGKLTVYLEKREFFDNTTSCEPIIGVIVVDDDYLQKNCVFAQLTVTYQYGRVEDEVMGVKFTKEFLLCHKPVHPKNNKIPTRPLQKKLLQKLGKNAHPFSLEFPINSPNSVTIRDEDRVEGNPLGVSYAVQFYVGVDDEDPKISECFIAMSILKLQHAPAISDTRLPMAWISKGLAFAQGKIDLEVTLDHEYFFHGDQIPVSIVIINESSRTINYVKSFVTQHTEVTMIDKKYKKEVASLETREGFPIEAGNCLTKYIYLVPAVENNCDRFGLALDGCLKDEQPHLASSTMAAEGHFIESIGIVISYTVTVELDCGTFGGVLATEVPFKLINPPPGNTCSQRSMATRRRSSSSLFKEKVSEDVNGLFFRGFRRTSITKLE